MSKILAREQPCGCIVCYCRTDDRCSGRCGATRCDSIEKCVLSGDMRTAIWVDDPQEEDELTQLRAELKSLHEENQRLYKLVRVAKREATKEWEIAEKAKYHKVWSVEGHHLYATSKLDLCTCNDSLHIAGIGCL